MAWNIYVLQNCIPTVLEKKEGEEENNISFNRKQIHLLITPSD